MTQEAQPKIVIRQFRDEDRAAVGAIFIDGFPPIPEEEAPKLHEYLRSCLESDLADVAGTYINPGGNFWVAIMETTESKEPQVVGMVALEKKVNNDGELRRMSVKREFRRYGVGKLLVVELEQWAKANGYKTVSLSTGKQVVVAQKFYSAIGYEKTGERPIPEMPNLSVFDYRKHL